jgi:ethanolamine ammonia-lyase small subunit
MDDKPNATEFREDRSDLIPSLPQTGTARTLLESIRARTSARILMGRIGAAYRTTTWLALRRDHAMAKDAIRVDFDLVHDLGAKFVAEWQLFEVRTQARTKEEFLLHPELGRRLCDSSAAQIAYRCPVGPIFQVAIADGLSSIAVMAQVPELLPLLADEANRRGWPFGQPFFIRHGRVGVLNDIGELIQPTVAVLLIGERPGLATSASLSAYMAFRPCNGHNDSNRNVISNIHAGGITPDQAAPRIIRFAARMIDLQVSGSTVRELPFLLDQAQQVKISRPEVDTNS